MEAAGTPLELKFEIPSLFAPPSVLKSGPSQCGSPGPKLVCPICFSAALWLRPTSFLLKRPTWLPTLMQFCPGTQLISLFAPRQTPGESFPTFGGAPFPFSPRRHKQRHLCRHGLFSRAPPLVKAPFLTDLTHHSELDLCVLLLPRSMRRPLQPAHSASYLLGMRSMATYARRPAFTLFFPPSWLCRLATSLLIPLEMSR